MDNKRQRLKELTGQDDIWADSPEIDLCRSLAASPKKDSEPTDSEDDEIVTSREIPPNRQTDAPVHPSRKIRSAKPPDLDRRPIREYRLEQGELAEKTERFCPWKSLRKYPYEFIGTKNKDKVAQAFFEEGKIYEAGWDLFYLHRPLEYGLLLRPTIFVPTEQVERFLGTINDKFGTTLTIPKGGANQRFQILFDDEGIPRPRYLGRTTSRREYDSLTFSTPHRVYGMDGEDPSLKNPTGRTRELFQAKVNIFSRPPPTRQAPSKQTKKEVARLKKEKALKHTIQNIQGYLGLLDIKSNLQNTLEADKDDYLISSEDVIIDISDTLTKRFDLLKFTPDKNEGAVFICVDIEAWEQNASVITEIGIATIDSEDLRSIPPGEKGVNWRKAVRARHFRISEHRHHNNTRFVSGCADNFLFGESEFIKLADAQRIVSSCFKYPFSNPNALALGPDEEPPKRDIVLVGHETRADVGFLRKLGYNVTNLSNLKEVVDTAKIWQYLHQEEQTRSLAFILSELGIEGWHLHNGGNDATYTLQAMLAIAVQSATGAQGADEDQPGEVFENEREENLVQSERNPRTGVSAHGRNAAGKSQSQEPQQAETLSDRSSSNGGVILGNWKD